MRTGTFVDNGNCHITANTDAFTVQTHDFTVTLLLFVIVSVVVVVVVVVIIVIVTIPKRLHDIIAFSCGYQHYYKYLHFYYFIRVYRHCN